MVLGFDLDGVIVDSPQKVCQYVNDRLDLNLSMDDFKTYCMEDALPPKYKWIIEAAFRDSALWKQVKLIDGAYDIIQRLWDEGYEIYFITSSLPENLKKKIGHLARNLSFMPYDYVWKHTINTQCKQMIKVDILVDDALHNLMGERDYFSICMDMAYNQTNAIIPNFTRAKDWNEIYQKIHMVEKLITEDDKWED